MLHQTPVETVIETGYKHADHHGKSIQRCTESEMEVAEKTNDGRIARGRISLIIIVLCKLMQSYYNLHLVLRKY